ncbi:MAG: hypothetical protein LBL35_03165 [Clostridiales bacterium]|nr:hypothetical protein [Clostridiales bacterium]
MRKKIRCAVLFTVIMFVGTLPVKTASGAVTAIPASTNVLIGAKVWRFDAHNIGGYNYFKLRDLAYALNETPKKFSVDWDAAKNAITLTRGNEYKATGEEMAPKGTDDKAAVFSTDTVYLGGDRLHAEAYNIDGYNYYKLRDLGGGSALNFSVEFSEDTNSIVIFTSAEKNPYLDYFIYAGKVGVLKKDAWLSKPYVITVDENGNDIVERCDNLNMTLSKNDIVIVIKDENGQSRVLVPYGDNPRIRGYLKPDDISFNSKDFVSANQCVLRDTMKTYDANGKELGKALNGAGKIVERKSGKVLVQPLGGGADSFWISEKDLSFDFDVVVVDIANSQG